MAPARLTTLRDMAFEELDLPSPNHASDPPHEQLGVCFHHTILPWAEALARLRDPASRVSYHVLIALDGRRARLVADDRVAWHAGVSSFQGREGANAFLLGLAFEGDTYRSPLTSAQLDSALEWLAERWAARGWSLPLMTDHRQIAPGRKDDLNPVEWERLRGLIARRFGNRPAA